MNLSVVFKGILLLIVFQLQSFCVESNVQGFEEGKQYTYEFKARSATGTNGKIPQVSGFGLKSKLIIQKTGLLLRFHLTDLHYGSFNTKVKTLLDDVHIDYQRLSTTSQEYNVNLLEQTFWVEFDNGVFKAIYFNPGEDIAKHNNKKSIADLFQLDLKIDGRRNSRGYVHHEDSWDGICDTFYVIGRPQYRNISKENTMTVTKIRDYNNCTVRPHLFHSSLLGHKIAKSSQKYTPIIYDYAEVQYSLKRTRTDYKIEEIHSTSGFSFTPFTTNGQTIVSMVNQRLTLESVTDAPNIEIPEHLDKHLHLYHEFNIHQIPEEDKHVHKAHYYNKVFNVNRDDRIEKATSLFNELQRSTREAEHLDIIPRLVKEFQKFDYEDFVTFFDTHVFSETISNPNWKIALKVLPLVGTNPAILYTFDVIKTHYQKQSTEILSCKLVRQLPFHVKEPTNELLNAINTIRKEYHRHNDLRHLRNTITLAYGTFLYKACNKDVFNPHPLNADHYVSTTDCSNYIRELIEEFEQTKDSLTKQVLLKSIINAQTKDTFQFAISVIESDKYDELLKQHSMFATFRQTGSKAKQIISLLSAILLDQEADHFSRFCAFYVLLHGYPIPALFGKVILLLKSDPSYYTSYIYFALKAYVESADPDTQHFQKMAKHILQFAEPYNETADSMFKHFSYFNEKYNYGHSFTFLTRPNTKTISPRELYMAHSMNILGYSFSPGELIIFTDDFEYLKPLLPFPSGLNDVFKPLSVHSNFSLLEDTVEKFKFRSTNLYSKSHTVYDRIFYKDVFITDHIDTYKGLYALTEDEITPIIKNTHKQFQINTVTLNYINMELIRPNALGMPVYLKLDVPMIKQANGIVRPETTLGYMDFHYGGDMNIRSQIYVHSLLFGNLGYELQTKLGFRLPIKLHADLETAKIIHFTPDKPYEILYYKSVPKTFGSFDLPLESSSARKQKQYNVGHQYFGAGLTIRYEGKDHGSYLKFLKPFYQKSQTNEHYSGLLEKYLTGTRSLLDYALLNPTAEPVDFNITFERCTLHPATEFHHYINVTLKESDYSDLTNNKLSQVFNYESADSSWSMHAKGTVPRSFHFKSHLKFSSTTPEHNEYNINTRFKRSLIPGYDDNPLEVCFTSYATSIPNISLLSSQVLHKFDLVWGEKCEAPNSKLALQATGSKSEEQQTKTEKLERVDKFVFDLEFQNITKKTSATLKKLSSWFQHHFYNNLHVDPYSGSGQETKLHVVANVSRHQPTLLDVKVVRPEETAYYSSIHIPNFDPFYATETLPQRLARKLNIHLPTCKFTGSTIRTFDGLSYKTSLSNGHHLVFANTWINTSFIYFNAAQPGTDLMNAKVFIHHHIVEFAHNHNILEVFVDGSLINVEPAHPYKYFDEDVSLFSTLYEIYRVGSHDYLLISEYYGFKLRFNGVDSNIVASFFHRGRQQGLCGNFDGDPTNDFQGPDGHVYEDSVSFAQSYVVEDHR